MQYNLYLETTLGKNESGLLKHVVFKCRFYKVNLRRCAVSKQWSHKAVVS